jgi:hypothetical protein
MVLVNTNVADSITTAAGVNVPTFEGVEVGGFPNASQSYIHGDNSVGGSRKQRQSRKQQKQSRKQQKQSRKQKKTHRKRRPHPKYRKSKKHMRNQVGRGGTVYGFQGVDLQELGVGSQGATYAPVDALNNQNIPSPNN